MVATNAENMCIQMARCMFDKKHMALVPSGQLVTDGNLGLHRTLT